MEINILTEVKDVVKEISSAFEMKSDLKTQEHKIIWAHDLIKQTRDFISKTPELYTEDEIKSLDAVEKSIDVVNEYVNRSTAFFRKHGLKSTITMEVTL